MLCQGSQGWHCATLVSWMSSTVSVSDRHSYLLPTSERWRRLRSAVMSPHPKRAFPGTSLVVQWLRLCVPNAGGPGWIPGQGTRSYMPQLKVSCAITKTRCSQTKQQNRLETFLNLLPPTSVNSITAVPSATGQKPRAHPWISSLTFHTHCVSNVSECWLCLQSTPRIHNLTTTTTQVPGPTISHLDSCNSLLPGHPASVHSPLSSWRTLRNGSQTLLAPCSNHPSYGFPSNQRQKPNTSPWVTRSHETLTAVIYLALESSSTPSAATSLA